MPLTAYVLRHLRWALPRTRVLLLRHLIVPSNGATPDTGTLLRPDVLAFGLLLPETQLCLNHAAAFHLNGDGPTGLRTYPPFTIVGTVLLGLPYCFGESIRMVPS